MVPAVRVVHLDSRDALACGNSLKEKTVVVTGMSFKHSGTRHSATQCLGEDGDDLTFALGDHHMIRACLVISDVNIRGLELPCDTSNWDHQLEMFEFACETFGRVDVVVANAGVGEMSQFMKEENLDASGHLTVCRAFTLYPKTTPDLSNILTIDVNLIGALFTIKIGYHYLKKNPAKEGKALLYIGSIYSANALPKGPLYATTKHSIYSLFKSMYADCQEAGIATNIMAPWFVRTGIVAIRTAIVLHGLPYASISDVVAGMIKSCADPNFHGNHVVVDPQGLLVFPFACPHLGPQGYIGESYGRSTIEMDRKTKFRDMLLIVRAMGGNLISKSRLVQLAVAVALVALVRRRLKLGAGEHLEEP
ncbi:BZ3500_MvSof-1268-A1-R1_Chr5-2g07866 [Microbotryum saponariae]|uniref:BZ3500_MvSof-1268-A1-R1_Chr5-2g07866 protein n=1 Tax=Microbotryum saponariae TaxID=289078 RepID=A0A2X0M966_9BASI|nr:BZ3500_MvSof-1268-A1-R1_Chr5-2g07866 [Microbotryum saponariae]SDA05735.1 BZ3501_MvSof-1269-A2-R1_Chr5-2g07688 [Microbotryum saponariae]